MKHARFKRIRYKPIYFSENILATTVVLLQLKKTSPLNWVFFSPIPLYKHSKLEFEKAEDENIFVVVRSKIKLHENYINNQVVRHHRNLFIHSFRYLPGFPYDGW